jgi:hypothetical protein
MSIRMRGLFALTLALACSPKEQHTAQSADAPMTKELGETDRISIAMSAAPAAIAAAAAIMDFDDSGKLVELRPGTNGWTCLADDSPVAPGDSPNCFDQRWLSWFDAYEQKKTPAINGIGMAYMLQGSLSPSNTDPFLEKPASDAGWMTDGPHVMVILPDPALLDAFSADHTSGGPYVMYKGTPYAHLMVPVPSPQSR